MPLATTYRPAEIRKVLRIGDIDTLLTASTVLGKDMQQMLEDSVPGLADATGAAPLPPRHAVAARDLGDRRRRPRVGDAGRPRRRTGDDRRRDRRRSPPRGSKPRSSPADLAQVTYTSGSSAEPKGVVHTHGTVDPRDERALPRCAATSAEPPVFFCAFPFFWIGGTLVLGAALQSGRNRARASSGSSRVPRSTSSSASRPARCWAGRRCCRRCATTPRSPTASFPRSRASPSAPPTWPSRAPRCRASPPTAG